MPTTTAVCSCKRCTATERRISVSTADVSMDGLEILPDGRMTAPMAANYVGLSKQTLAMYRWRGIGPQFVKRGRIFYFKSDLDEWITHGRSR